MSLDSTVIDMAVNKKYTEFSASVKTEIQNKLTNHPISVKYAGEYDKIQQMKQVFSQINGQSEE
jgi:hypothetical protein